MGFYIDRKYGGGKTGKKRFAAVTFHGYGTESDRIVRKVAESFSNVVYEKTGDGYVFYELKGKEIAVICRLSQGDVFLPRFDMGEEFGFSGIGITGFWAESTTDFAKDFIPAQECESFLYQPAYDRCLN
jgi:hypothetical protein